MNKNVKVSLATAGLLALATSSTTVLAEETPTPNTQPTIETEATEVAPQITSETIKPAVDEVMVEVTEAEKNLADVENQTATAEETVKQAQEDVATAKEQVAKDQDRVNELEKRAEEASPEAIAQAESDVETAGNKVVDAENTLSREKAERDTAKQHVDAQKDVVEENKKAVSDAETTLAETEKALEDLKTTDTGVAIADANDKMTEAMHNVSKAITGVSDAKATLKTAEDQLQALKDKQFTVGAELFDKLTEAGEPTLTRTIQKDLGLKIPSAGYNPIRDRGRTLNGQYYKAVELVDYDGEREEVIVYEKKDNFDMKKVSQYVVEYLRELRKINGINIPIDTEDEIIRLAHERAEEEANEFGPINHGTSIDRSRYSYTYFNENAWESQGQYLGFSEKEAAYRILYAFFEDLGNESTYGHRTMLLGSNGYTAIGMVENLEEDVSGLKFNSIVMSFGSRFNPENGLYNGQMALDLDRDPSEHGTYTVREYVTINQDTGTSYSQYLWKGKPVKFLPKTTFRYVSEEEVTEPNPAWVSAKKELDEFNATITEKIAKAQADVDTAKANLETAENNLKQAEVTKDQAQENLNKAHEAHNDFATALANAEKDVTDAITALGEAKQRLAGAEATYDTLVEKHAQEESDVETAEADLETAKEELKTAETRVAELKNVHTLLPQAKQTLAESQQLLADAETRLSLAEADLETLKGILTTAKETLAEKQDLYNQLKDYYDKLVDIERLSVDNTVTILEDGTIVAVPKTAPTATEKPEFDLNSLTKPIQPSTKPSEQTGDKVVEKDNKANQTATTEMSEIPTQSSYSRMEKNHKTLPETGSVESTVFTTIGTILLGFGLVGKRRKVN